jgi:hypothetical protein
MLKQVFRRLKPERASAAGGRGGPRGPRATARTAARLWPGALERRWSLVLTYAGYLGDDPAGWRLGHLKDEVAGLCAVADSIALAAPGDARGVHEAVRSVRVDVARLLAAAAVVASGGQAAGWWPLVRRLGESVTGLCAAVKVAQKKESA